MSDLVTIVLTSCNRPKELTITLRSFFRFNTYPIKEIIIVDDSGIKDCICEAIKEIPNNIEKRIIYNEQNIGQCKSIDKAYALVGTEYIFHCEDDWEFYDYSFVEKSMEILKQRDTIFCVWLRGYSNFKVIQNGHPVIPDIYNGSFRLMGVFQERTNIWSGFTLNPGLRRTVDCKLLMPYSQFINSKECNLGGIEQALSNMYYRNDFTAAITLNEKGFIRHIGGGNPCPRNY